MSLHDRPADAPHGRRRGRRRRRRRPDLLVPSVVVLLGLLSGLLQTSAAAWQVFGVNGGNVFGSGTWGVPGAPTGLTASPTTGQAVLTWTAPAANGSTVTGYSATAAPGGATCTATAPTTTCTLTGLTDGVSYTVSVLAHSNIGDGPAATVTAIPYPSSVMSPARLSLWLDGADSSTMFTSSGCTGANATTAGSALGCWKDKSTSANNAVQATGASQPVLATVASRPVPGFDGTASAMALTPGLLPNGTTASATFVVGRLTDPSPSGSGFRTLLSWGAATIGGTRSYQKISGSAQAAVDAYSLAQSSGGSWVTNAIGILDDDWGSASYTGSFNGAVGGTVSGTLNTGTTTAALGQQVNGSDLWQGQVPEVIVLTGAATTAERRTVEEYLARKWSVVLTPRAPTGVAATAGDASASVSWTAPSWDGGAAVTGYWVVATPSDGSLSTVVQSCGSSPCTLTGLANGATYTVTVSATNSAGSGPGAVAASTVMPYPATIMSAARLVLWLDAADTSTLFASSSCTGAGATTAVGCWKDKSVQLNHLSQATGGSQPGTATVTGRTVPSFNGSQYLSGTASLMPTGTTDGTIVMAGAVNPAVAMNGIAAIDYGGTTNGSQRRITSWVQAGADVSGSPMAFPSAWPAGQAQGVVSASFTSGALVSAWANSDTGASTAGAFSTGSHHLWLGAGGLSTPSGSWNGTIPEVLAFTGAVSAAERRSLEEYLAHKWGGVITPQAPTAVAATTADAATSISWTAPAWNGGSAVTSYTATLVPSDGSANLTCTSATSPCAVSGLTNGLTYTITVTATNAAGAGPASSAVTVTPYPTGLFSSGSLKVWLDAQNGASLSAATDCSGSNVGTGSGVGCWKDRSGNGWNAPRGGSTSAVLTASAINGKPALRFVKTNPDYYEVTAAGIGTVGSNDRTVLAIVNPRTTYGTAATQSASFVAGWSLGYAGGIMAHANSGTTTTIDEIQADGYTSTATGIYAGVASSGTVIASALFSSSGGTLTSSFAPNGRGALVSSSAAGSWYPNGDQLRVGAVNSPANGSYNYPLDGDVGEVLVFNRTLTAAERRTAEEYLARHWAQSIAPSAVAAPTVTKPAGGSLKATWAAPAWNGGSAVTGFTVTAAPGGLTCTGGAAATNCTISGLTPGTTYSLTVTATNAAGTGPASAGTSGTA